MNKIIPSVIDSLKDTRLFFLRAPPQQKKKRAKKKEVAHKSVRHAKAWKPIILFQPRFSSKDQMFFAKRLSFLVKSGVPILESVHILREQTTRADSARVYDALIEDVSNGKSLYSSLKRFPHAFGDFALHIVRVGEMSGILSKNLLYLADELEKRYALKKKIQGAMVYPIFITVGTLGLTILLTAFIFPKIMPIFVSLNVTLPLTTQILIAVSDFVRVHGITTLAGVVGAGFLFTLLVQRFEKFRFFIDRLLIGTPIVGGIVVTYNMANVTRTLGILLKSNLAVTEAVSITADATVNRVYRAEFRTLARKILAGEQVSKQLTTKPKLFPPLMVHMIAIGERTGGLPDSLLYLAELYEGEIDELTKNLSSVLEPAMMVVMGLVVGFVAVSVITPIYSITQSLSG